MTTPPNALVVAFNKETDHFLKLLPTSAARERLQEFVLEALMSPELQRCNADSVLVAVMKSAKAGLPIDGVLSAIVPFKGVATFCPMYKGVLQLIRRGDKIRQVWTELVFETDVFDYNPVTREIKHTRVDRQRTDPDKVTDAYACFRWNDGFIDTEVMTRDQLDKIWHSSPAQNGPWKSHRCEMYRKTVLRRGAKNQPLPDEVLTVLQEDEYDEETPRDAEVMSDGRQPPKDLRELAERRMADKATRAASAATVQPAASQVAQEPRVVQAHLDTDESLVPLGRRYIAKGTDGIDYEFVLGEMPALDEWMSEQIGGKSPVLRDLAWCDLWAGGNAAAVAEARKQVAPAARQAQAGGTLADPVRKLIACLANVDDPLGEGDASGSLFGTEVA